MEDADVRVVVTCTWCTLIRLRQEEGRRTFSPISPPLMVEVCRTVAYPIIPSRDTAWMQDDFRP